MTVPHTHPVTAVQRVPTLGAATAKQRAAWSSAAIATGAPAYVAACGLALFVDWRVGVALVVAAGIVGVLIANRVMSARLVVDDDVHAVERLLTENEQEYPPFLTGAEAEWARFRGSVAAFSHATAHGLRGHKEA